MIRKLILTLTVLLLIPAFANAWYVNAKTSPAAGQGAITPAGNQSYAAGSNSGEYTVSPALGYKVSRVALDGVSLAPNANGRYVVPYLSSKTWRYLVAYFAAGTVNITTQVTGGSGAIREDTHESLTNIPLGSNRQLLVIPNPGYAIASVTAAGAAITDNGDGSKTAAYSNLQSSRSVSASFSLVPAVTASAGNDVTANGAGAEFAAVLYGAATSNQGVVNYAWSGAGLSFGTPNAAVTTVYAAVPGSYTATLTVTSGSLTLQDSAMVTVLNRTENLSAFCSGCHSMNTPQVTTQYYASLHSGRTACQDCHTPEPHTGVVPTSSPCVNCHADSSGNVLSHPLAIGTNSCLSCHYPHSTRAFAGVPDLHYNNITSAGYPASFMTSRANCADCHYESSENATIRGQWASSGHAALTESPWTAYDFKTRSGCVQCHTTTGFIAYSSGKISSAWGVAADKTREVLTCIGCHSNVTTGVVRTVSPIRPYADDAYVNRSVGTSNICMSCHSGLNNGTSISAKLAALADFNDLPFIPPHYRAAGGILHGQGGYHFAGPTPYGFYSSNSHRTAGMADSNGTGTGGPCVACHMSAPARHLFNAVSLAANGTIAQITATACVNCHTSSFDATQLNTKWVSFGNAMDVLKAMLARKGFVHTGNYPYFSSTNWGTGQNGANNMGAAFNYVLLLKEPGAYAHNAEYTRKLIFDSIDYLYNGSITGSIEGALAALVTDGSITQQVADSVAEYSTSNSCTSCHGNTSGSHPAHLAGGSGCDSCHSATALSNSALVPGTTTHVNGTYDLVAGQGRSFSYTQAPTGGTCSSISCHNNGTAVWGGTLGCDGCHGNPPAYANNSPKANSHANHNFTCNTCHAGTTADGVTIFNKTLHANGVSNLMAGAGTSFTYLYASTGGTCSNISCHGNTSATWGSTLGCATCHGNPPPGAAGSYTGVNEATSPHMKHSGTGDNYSLACSECHKGNSHGTGTFQDVFIIQEGIIAGPAATYTPATRTCSALYCHSTGTSLATGQTPGGSVVWGPNKLTCNGCHGNPPAYSNNAPKSNSHANHNFACNTCHAGTTGDGLTISNKSLHVNGAYNVTPDSGTTFTYAYSATGGTCSNVDCHQGVNAKWGRNADHAATLGIGSFYFVSGSHDDGEEWMSATCVTCHYANIVTQHNNDCSVCHAGANPPANPLLGTWDKTCSSCHQSFHTPASTEHSAYVNLDNCDECHGGDWEVDCTFCHSQLQTLTSYINKHPPLVDTPPAAIKGNLRLLVHMDEPAWNGTLKQVKDSSGWNGHGTSFNGANTVAGGVSGQSGSFNGFNSNVVMRYPSGAVPVDNFTIEAWVRPTVIHEIDAELNTGSASGTAGQKYLFWPNHSGDYNAGAGISVGTNGISVYEHGSGYMPALAVYSGAISSSQWTHIAVVYANKRPSIYVNGALVRIGLQSLRQHVYAPDIIGGEVYGYYFGQVDEAAVYDAALTANEILQHAQQLCTSTSNTAISIRWTSAIASSSYVDYGLTTGYGATAGSDELVTTHVIPLSGLADNTTYHYRVRSTAADGTETISGDNTLSSSNCAAISNPPSAPTGISASAGSGQATISWTAGTGASTSLLRYGLTSANLATTIDPATSPRTITGLTNGTPLYYQVGAQNAAGTTWNSSIFNVTPAGPPAAPTAISAVAGNAQATITWTAGTGSTSSLIRYGTTSGNLATTIDPAASPQTITGLANGTRIYYQVGAKNTAGTTWNSTIYNVTPAGPPAAPTAISAVAGNAQATITWTAGTGSTSSLIRYGTTSANLATIIDPAASPRTITGLTNGTTIYYQVGAKNTAGITWNSTIYNVTPAGPPVAPPTAISAVAGNTQATITWTAGTGSTSSLIRYGTTSGNLATIIDPATSPRTITGLANGTPVYYQVGAKNTSETAWSAEYSVTPAASSTQTWTTPGSYTFTVPSGVTSLTVTAKGAGGAGGGVDNVYNQQAGTNGNLVTGTVAVTPGSQLTVYVAGGGSFNNSQYQAGAGGFGYHNGANGGYGEGDYDAWSYGGAGGGGSSAVILTLSSTLVAEAAGGAGGRSSDYDDDEFWSYDGGYYNGGAGGAGGGSNYPAATANGGGGVGGGFGLAGAGGAVSITY